MKKAEFLETLRSQLTGEIATTELQNTMKYYEEYITDAVGSGKNEADVMAELGSPLLIARTIIDTAKTNADTSGKGYGYEEQQKSAEDRPTYRQYNISSIGFKITVAVVIILLLVIILTVLRVLIPILAPILIIAFIVSIIKRGGRS